MKYFFRTVMLKACFTDAMTKYWLVTECSLNKDRIVKWWMNSPRIYLSINSLNDQVIRLSFDTNGELNLWILVKQMTVKLNLILSFNLSKRIY